MTDHHPWEFTGKRCGGHQLTVTRVWLVATQPWWAHISGGMLRLYTGRMLAGTQVFGFLAAKELAPNLR